MNELDRYAVSVENMEVLRAQVDELEAWKAEELALMNPLMDYARSVCTGPLGCSITGWLVEDHQKQAREIERLQARAALSANHSEQVLEECRHEFSDDGEFTVHCSKCDLTINAEPPRHVLDSAAQQAFEAGGTEDGGYVLTGDDLDQIVAQSCAEAVIEFAAAAPSAGSQKEQK